MGGQQSLPQSPGAQAAGVVAGVGVAALVREVGLAMIPAHLRHTLESITQIIGNFVTCNVENFHIFSDLNLFSNFLHPCPPHHFISREFCLIAVPYYIDSQWECIHGVIYEQSLKCFLGVMLLRSATDLCYCILETATKLRAFDEAPYTSSAVMLAALVRHAQLEQLQQLELARAGGVAPVARWAGACLTLDTPSPDTDTEASTCFAEDRRCAV